jgi:hypothetical protein
VRVASDVAIKEGIRERDGYKCRDCGMTQDEHKEQVGTALEVHRLLPGVGYDPFWCVTLCRGCHDKKPGKLAAAIFGDDITDDDANPYPKGIVSLFLIPYLHSHRVILDAYREQAAFRGEDPIGLMLDAIAAGVGTARPVVEPIQPVQLDFDLSAFV